MTFSLGLFFGAKAGLGTLLCGASAAGLETLRWGAADMLKENRQQLEPQRLQVTVMTWTIMLRIAGLGALGV